MILLAYYRCLILIWFYVSLNWHCGCFIVFLFWFYCVVDCYVVIANCQESVDRCKDKANKYKWTNKQGAATLKNRWISQIDDSSCLRECLIFKTVCNFKHNLARLWLWGRIAKLRDVFSSYKKCWLGHGPNKFLLVHKNILP